MALTYSSFVSEIASLTAITSGVLVNGDNNFAGIMPGIIDYAEGRLWRELDPHEDEPAGHHTSSR